MREIAYVIDNGYLSHSGIPGMKWGQKNGPPYPIREGGHSAAEVKANPKLAGGSSGGSGSSADSTKVRMPTSKREIRRMSMDELKQRIERLNTEDEYKKLNGKLTGSQISEIRSMILKDSTNLFVNEVPKAVVDVGKEVVKLEMTFAKKLVLMIAPKLCGSSK